MITHFEPRLGDTFSAYQQATYDVVQWVASTARSTGSVANLLGGRSEKQRSLINKLRGSGIGQPLPLDELRGRKRPPTTPARQTTGVPSSPEIEISYETLGKLGRAIANTNNVEVDCNVLVALKGIIHARKGFAT
ncbi:hypothetical protein E8E11_001895 [Didymella keratinophila]|nr:hypothetical protein E8E11_001895 [Didymella keratinophila]